MLPHSNPQPYPQYSFKENKTWVNKIKKEEKNDKTDNWVSVIQSMMHFTLKSTERFSQNHECYDHKLKK